MASVLGYWCLPEEEVDLLNYLNKWEIYAYDPGFFTNLSDIKPLPINALISERNPSQPHFGPKQFFSEKDIGLRTQIGGIPQYGVIPHSAHAIGYSRPHFDKNGALRKANWAVYWKYWDKGILVEKNPEFVKWGKKVFSWGRKWACEKVMLHGYPYPATKRVKELLEQNKLTVDS